MTPDTAHGKAFERELSEAFSDLYKSHRCRFERVLDSAAAGNLVKAADSDFKLMVKSENIGCPYVVYIEAKASKQGKPFGKCFRSLVKSNQNASLQMVRRSGAVACVFFHNMTDETIEIWRGRNINDNYAQLRKPMLERAAIVFPAQALRDFAIEMVTDPARIITHIGSLENENWVVY